MRSTRDGSSSVIPARNCGAACADSAAATWRCGRREGTGIARMWRRNGKSEHVLILGKKTLTYFFSVRIIIL